MAYTTINKSTEHFNTKLYTGTGSSNAQTGVGFQPDWVWLKNRSSSSLGHQAFDVVRGVTKRIFPNDTAVQETDANALTAFGSDGFTVGSNTGVNASGDNIVAWNWKAANSQGSSNTDGSINTTYTSANTTAGFSISQYVGTGSNATIGHGLGAVPKWIIVKNLSASGNSWCVYHSGIGNTAAAFLEGTVVPHAHVDYWNNTSPTSSVFYIGAGTGTNGNGNNLIAYCFAEKTGYSKFGKYTGNGSTDGTFVYTGFRPAWVMSKRTDSSDGWRMRDSKRDIDNPAQHRLLANATDAEVVASSQDTDFLSNGFKIRNSDSGYNASGGTYVYMAFAEAPIVGTNNIPAVAR